mmetsp:Transcript_19244/g.40121  ORF Transcript_19244/g.40121 Transcript_19244/m.40121 type:complete len:392 (+) Transcript_19244:51-1226(+)
MRGLGLTLTRSILASVINFKLSALNLHTHSMEAYTRASYYTLSKASVSSMALCAQGRTGDFVKVGGDERKREVRPLSTSDQDSGSPALIDADCNFLHPDMPSLSSLVSHESTKKANIVAYLSPASTLEESEKMLEVLTSFESPPPAQIKTTVGIHPYHASEAPPLPSLSTKITQFLSDERFKPHISAVGETGLDYSEGFPPSSVQLPVFEEQVKVACAHNVPLFVHTRLAHEDTLSVLTKAKDEYTSLPPVLVHCFTGTESEVRDYLALGFYIGITGFINKGYGAEVKDILSRRIIPLDRLCIETDAPYMGFDGCRRSYVDSDKELSTKTGKERKKLIKQQYPNVPSSLPLVLKGVTEALNSNPQPGNKIYSEEEIAAATTSTSRQFFSFK